MRSMPKPARNWRIPPTRFLLGAFVLVLLFVAYARAFRGHVIASRNDPDDPKAALLLAAAVTVFVFFTLLGLARLVQALGERRRLGAFAAGRAFRDGEFAAVEGSARAEGDVLRAPFSDRPCLAYEYEVRLPPATGSIATGQRFVGLAGIALAPTAIEGPHGRARLLGWAPLGERFPCEWFDPGQDREVARRLLKLRKNTRFERMSGLRGLRLIGRFFDLQSDDDGRLRQDWCIDDAGMEAKDVRLSEGIIEPGTPLAASGLWAEGRGGIYGQVGRVALDVWAGTIKEHQRRLVRQSAGPAVLLLVLSAALHGMVALVWHSAEEVAAARAELHRRRTVAALDQVLWRDVEGTRAALRAGVDPNRRDHYGDTLLMTAARERDPKWVKMLLEEGADLEAVNPRWGSALTQAITTNRHESAALLLAAGAGDFRIGPANGRPLPRDGGEPLAALRAYYAAIEKSDRAGVDRLHAMRVEGDIDWDLWRQVRPLDIREVEGYSNEQAATVTVRGLDPAGGSRTWAYHLVRAPSSEAPAAWRIEREWDLR